MSGWPQSPVSPTFDDVAFTGTPGQTKFTEFYDADGVKRWRKEKWLYNNALTIAVGRPYIISYAFPPATSPRVIDPAALAVDQECCVAITAVPTATWGWFAVEGYVEAVTDDTGAAADLNQNDYVKLDASDIAAAGVNCFTENGTTLTVNSFGVFADATAQTGGGTSTGLVFLLGKRAQVLA